MRRPAAGYGADRAYGVSFRLSAQSTQGHCVRVQIGPDGANRRHLLAVLLPAR